MDGQVVKRGGTRYRIKCMPRLLDDDGKRVSGRVDTGELMIYVDDELPTYRKLVTLWHEVIHIGEMAAGQVGDDEDEKGLSEGTIDALAFGIVDLLLWVPWLRTGARTPIQDGAEVRLGGEALRVRILPIEPICPADYIHWGAIDPIAQELRLDVRLAPAKMWAVLCEQLISCVARHTGRREEFSDKTLRWLGEFLLEILTRNEWIEEVLGGAE